jgi:hypothetical protein
MSPYTTIFVVLICLWNPSLQVQVSFYFEKKLRRFVCFIDFSQVEKQGKKYVEKAELT